MDGDSTNQQPTASQAPAQAGAPAPASTPTPTPAPTEPVAGAPAPSAAQVSSPTWAQYVGHIVRWEDGTSWYVQNDGRHWIPDGGTYVALQQKGAQVFNLPADQLDQIPDIKGSQAHA